MGKKVFVRLIDRGKNGWDHVNFDDFVFHSEPPAKAVAATSRQTQSPVLWHLRNNPAKPTAGDRIEGLDAPLAEGVFVFHAGTVKAGDAVVTAGGRVLTAAAHAVTFAAARAAAYEAVGRIHWRGEHHRSDIGHRAIARENS